MKTLFIGGQEDGKWHDVLPDRDYIRIPKKQEIPIVPITNEAKRINVTYNEFQYHREFLSGRAGKEYSVFVFAEDSDFCLIAILLKGYRNR